MARLTRQQIYEVALDLVKSNPGGIRWSQLVKQIRNDHPETKNGTITGTLAGLETKFPADVLKRSRGLYVPAVGGLDPPTMPPTSQPVSTRVREEDFYQPFADWLKSELDEATVAISLGGAGMQKKWGTPDIVGVYKPLASHRIKFDIELISAEIKVDPQQPVVAFGQAAAYRLFSAKSYIVMPTRFPKKTTAAWKRSAFCSGSDWCYSRSIPRILISRFGSVHRGIRPICSM